MKKVIEDCCLRTAKLLLCLVVIYCSSCSSLRIEDKRFNETTQSTLKVVVYRQDFIPFMNRMKELSMKAIDVLPSVEDNTDMRFLVLFGFTTRKAFLVGRSEILSTGLVKQIK